MNISGSRAWRQIGGIRSVGSSGKNAALCAITANGSGGREILQPLRGFRMTILIRQHHPEGTERVGSSLFLFRQLALKHVFNQRLQHALGEQIVQLRLEFLEYTRDYGINRILIYFA